MSFTDGDEISTNPSLDSTVNPPDAVLFCDTLESMSFTDGDEISANISLDSTVNPPDAVPSCDTLESTAQSALRNGVVSISHLSGGNNSTGCRNAESTVSTPGRSSYEDRLRQRLQLQENFKSKAKVSSPEPEHFGENRNDNHATSPTDSGITSAATNDSDSTAWMNPAGLSRVPVVCQTESAVTRLSRQVQYGRLGESTVEKKATKNRVKLHIYDLLPSESVMDVYGVHVPIGKCLKAMNDGMHALGTGVYHCGVEIDGVEYAYGLNEVEGASGIFTCIPMHSPGYEFRESMDFGPRKISKESWVKVLKEIEESEKGNSHSRKEEVFRKVEIFMNGRDIIQKMSKEYLGTDYDLLRNNCCTFARDACLRLDVKEDEIPTWFLNLADAGAQTQDSFMPIQNMLSFTSTDQQTPIDVPNELGFEVIVKETLERSTRMDIVKIIEAKHDSQRHTQSTDIGGEVRKALSWAY